MAKHTKSQLVLLTVVVTLILLVVTLGIVSNTGCSNNSFWPIDHSLECTWWWWIPFLVISGLFDFYMLGKIGKK